MVVLQTSISDMPVEILAFSEKMQAWRNTEAEFINSWMGTLYNVALEPLFGAAKEVGTHLYYHYY